MKNLLLILTCIVLVAAPFAQGASTSLLTAKTLTVSNNTQTTTTTTAATATTAGSCPTSDELDAIILKCKNSELDYTYSTDSNNCRQVDCKWEKQETTTCPTDEELNKKTSACNNEYVTYIDKDGCKQITCSSECSDINPEISKCKDAGKGYAIYADNNGCNKIKCGEKPQNTTITGTGTCKKYAKDGCVMITCDDGWQFDSCTYCTTGATQATTASAQTSTKKATAAETKGINPQPEPPKESNDQMIASKVMSCIKDEIKNAAEIDDEITWSKCEKQYTITTDAGKILSDIKKCVTDLKSSSAEIDDEITWAKCKGKYISESASATSKLSPQPDPPGTATAAGKPSDGTEKVALNPQPEPPAPTFFGKIGGWFKKVFGKQS